MTEERKRNGRPDSASGADLHLWLPVRRLDQRQQGGEVLAVAAFEPFEEDHLDRRRSRLVLFEVIHRRRQFFVTEDVENTDGPPPGGAELRDHAAQLFIDIGCGCGVR